MEVNTANRVNTARYIAWRRRKRRRKIISQITRILLIFVILGGLVLVVRSFGRDDDYLINGGIYAEDAGGTEAENSPNDSSNEPNDSPVYETSVSGNQTREPVIFCGTANPDNAEVLANHEAMSYLALVNNCYRLSSDFTPPDLSAVDVATVNPPWGSDVHHLRESAARATEQLFQAAAAEGLFLLMSSGYRSYDMQVFFHDIAIRDFGPEEARRRSAVPGHSEHQLGLAVDLTTHELGGRLDQVFIETPEGIWVSQNAHRFGFIFSFPYGREAETGIMYEPWHIRFVGVDVATEIFNAGQILEEFLWYNY